MKKILKWIGIIFGVMFLLGLVGAIFSDDTETTPAVESQPVIENEPTIETEPVETVTESVEPVEAVEPEPVEIVESPLSNQQKNAIRSAENYLSFQGFSKDGLIQQLSSDYGDGYSLEDATVAVENLDVDWNEQATRSAKNYLQTQGFSCDGLIQQLSSPHGDKFTVSEAEFGAKQAGACD